MDNVDLVVLYVDGSDPVWQEQYKNAGYEVSDSNGARFRSNDQFKYFFRAAAKYAPFIHKIFLVVSTVSQVPEWINRDEVEVITHDQIIPQELLPTFNSGTIELFIHNIPDLSEQFIYCNDDMFFMAPTTREDFFRDGKVCMKMQLRSLAKAKTMFRKMCLNDVKLVEDYSIYPKAPEGHYYSPYHVAAPMLKSVNQMVYDQHSNEIINSCTPKRSDKNLTQYIYTESLAFKGLTIESMPTYRYIEFSPSKNNANEMYKVIMDNTIQLLCINDTTKTPPSVRDGVKKSLMKRFPKTCKYEIGGHDDIEKKNSISQHQGQPIDFFSYGFS